MFRLFPLVVVLQAFCLYHAYKNSTEQKWFWLIIVLPFFGSVIYLYYHFFNRVTVDTVSENITKVVNTNYKIEKLEKEVKFSNTVANKTLLADEYINIGVYEKAIDLYESCLEGTHEDDADLLMGLIRSHYLNKDYEDTIKYASHLEKDTDFQKSQERIAYAWALSNVGAKEKAEEQFKGMDHQYSNYKQRLEYCNFLVEENRSTEAKEKSKELIDEIGLMDRSEQRLNRDIFNHIKNLYASIG